MHGRKPDPRDVIRALMAQRKIGSERELAILAHIDQSAFNRYMRGETAWLSTRNLRALAECLKVNSSQLLGELPIGGDQKIDAVLRAMSTMPEYKKDALVATAQSLAEPPGGKPKQ